MGMEFWKSMVFHNIGVLADVGLLHEAREGKKGSSNTIRSGNPKKGMASRKG